MAWLETTGTHLVARITSEEPDFLIEIDIDDQLLHELFRHLSALDPDDTSFAGPRGACLAVAAVQAAARADRDEESFRSIFFDRLGRHYDERVWGDSYGPAIARFLRERFSLDLPQSGPYCYVGAIYRHAGIPVPARAQFCHLLAEMVQRRPAVGRDDYLAAAEHVSSVVARDFMKSDAGYQFARDLVRNIVRIDHGMVGLEELAAFPTYRRSMIEDVLAEMRHAGARVRPPRESLSYPAPILALDAAARRLVIRFDRCGIRDRAYELDGAPVFYEQHVVRQGEPPLYTIKGEEVPRLVAPWWTPESGSVALFRASDGSYVSVAGTVAAGDYYLVTAEPDLVPEGNVLESGAYLESEEIAPDAPYYTILLVRVRPGETLGALPFHGKGTSPAPRLEFAAGGVHRWGGNVYFGSLPPLKLHDWTPESSARYWIWIDDGEGERRLVVPAGEATVQVRVPCPAQGTIFLEEKGRPHRSEGLPRLSFTVLPEGIELSLGPLIGIQQPALITLRTPPAWRVQWQDDLPLIASGTWELPPGERVADGQLVGGDRSLSFSISVPRAAVWFPGRTAHPRLLWGEDLAGEQAVVVESLPRRRCMLQLVTDAGVVDVEDLGQVDASGVHRTATRRFRDALLTAGVPCGEFAVSVDGGEPVAAGAFYAVAGGVVEHLGRAQPDSCLFRLPGIGSVLKSFRDMFERPVKVCAAFAGLGLPGEIAGCLADLVHAARAFDGTIAPDEPQSWIGRVSPGIKSAVEWYRAGVAAVGSLGGESVLLEAWPAEAVEAIGVDRWRAALWKLREGLETNRDLHSLLSEWRDEVTGVGAHGRAKLSLRAGGRDLSDAARRYAAAFVQPPGRVRNEILTRAIVGFRRATETVECDPVVRAVATALRQLACYHSERQEEAAAVAETEIPVAMERLRASVGALAHKCGGGRRVHGRIPDGIGWREISPRAEDALLEGEVFA